MGKDYFPSSGQDNPVIKFWRKHKEVTKLVKLHCVWASWEFVKWGPLSRTGSGICTLTSLQKRQALWSEDHHLSSKPLNDLWQGFLSLVLTGEGKHKGKATCSSSAFRVALMTWKKVWGFVSHIVSRVVDNRHIENSRTEDQQVAWCVMMVSLCLLLMWTHFWNLLLLHLF